MIDRSLADRTALVTSSSRNLGAAIARSLAEHGARVAIHYHSSREAAERLASDLTQATGAEHVVVSADSTRMDQLRGLVREAATRLGGRVDILVNNTGPFSITPLIRLPEADWDRVMDANLKAAYVASQEVAGGMRAAGWGRIVNVGAGSAYLRNHSVYGLAKNGIAMLTEQLALELGPSVTVNCVAPGQILESADDVGAVDPTFVERAIGHTPLGRLVTRSEVAEIVAALCGPHFACVTGITIPIDGGWRLNQGLGQDLGQPGRQAFSEGLSRGQLADITCAGATTCSPAAHGLISKGLAGNLGSQTDPMANYDPAKAKAEYQQWDPHGAKAASIRLEYITGPTADETFQNVQAQLRSALGVSIQLYPVDAKTALADRSNHRANLFSMNWFADYNHPQDWYDNLWVCATAHNGGENFSGYCNPQMDQIVTQADQMPLNSALTRYAAAYTLMEKQSYAAPLYYSTNPFFVQKWVSGEGNNGLYDADWTGVKILQH